MFMQSSIGQGSLESTVGQAPTDLIVTIEQTPNLIAELLRLLPTLLWVLLIAGVAIAFYSPIRHRLIPNMSSVSFLGVEANFIQQQLDEVAQETPTAAGSSEERSQVARRARRLYRVTRGARVLIVNDNPEDMRVVAQILRNLDMQIDIARTTEGALTNMEVFFYDVVISDMRRSIVPNEGQLFLEEAIKRGIERPTIFGVAQFEPDKGVPAYAFGITNHVDELLNLVLDVLERERS